MLLILGDPGAVSWGEDGDVLMSSLVKTRPAVFNDYYQLLSQLMKARESKAYLHAKTVQKALATRVRILFMMKDR